MIKIFRRRLLVEKSGNLSIEISSVIIQSQRRMRTRWTPELFKELVNARGGVDVSLELEQAIVNELKNNI